MFIKDYSCLAVFTYYYEAQEVYFIRLLFIRLCKLCISYNKNKSYKILEEIRGIYSYAK